jgi:hypothetical protein
MRNSVGFLHSMDISKERLLQLRNEIKMSETLNKEELAPIMEECLARYTGKFNSPYSREWDLSLNEIYPIIQYNLPSIFFRNPRAFLKPRNKTFIAKKRNPITGQMEEVEIESSKSAKTQEHILNYSLSEIKYKNETRKVLFDGLVFPHGVLWHGYKGDFGMTEENSLWVDNDNVFVKRINPIHFIHDPTVGMSNIDEGKWVGRVIEIPLADFFEDDKLDIDKALVKGYKAYGEKVGTKSMDTLKKMGETDEIRILSTSKSLIDFTDAQFQNSRMSRFVRLYEIFLRPTKKELRDGERGKILLLTPEQEKPLRVNDWRIKAKGFPSHILQFNELTDNMFGLSDIDTYKQIADQKNAIINLQLRNAQETGKIWVGMSKEGANEEDIEAVQRGDNTIVTFESGNPRDKMFVASGGGQASSELYIIDERIQRNLEDKSGVTDLKRGFLQSGEESATSVKLRSAGGSVRPAYRQDIMSDFLKGSFLYLNELLKQFVPYKEAVRIVGSLDLEWSENPTKEELQANIDVEIDVISMLPESPEKELQEYQMILTLMVQALNDPALQQKLAQEGKTFNLAPIIEQMLLRLRIRDPEVFRNIKPEESQGYASIQQLQQAKANVMSSVTGQPLQFPPQPTDDHAAKLDIYTTVQGILKMAGQVSDTLDQLIQIHTALLQAIQEKQATPGNKVSGLKKPSVQTVGA